MSSTAYLIVMVGVIAVVAAVATPALILKRCPQCGRHALVDTAACGRCGYRFPPVAP